MIRKKDGARVKFQQKLCEDFVKFDPEHYHQVPVLITQADFSVGTQSLKPVATRSL